MAHDARGPADWIVRHGPRIPAGGAVLDLACGAGRHTLWFLARGHPVTAVDRDRTLLTPLAAAGAQTLQADLEAGDWPLPGCSFDGVVVVDYLWRPLLPRLVGAVAPGGVLLYETFGRGNERFGRPRNPEFLLAPGELLEVVHGSLQVVAYEHGIAPGPAVRQRLCAVAAPEPQPLS